MPERTPYVLDHLDQLEAEGIHALREVVGQFERPGILFSGGKDSCVVVHLAFKALWPGRLSMPLVHVDTGHNFDETIAFRDALSQRIGARLVVGSVEDSIARGTAIATPGGSRNKLQSITLLELIEEHGFDALVGGARRDEEKARAKERFFSHRDEFGQWDPRRQRPELWDLYNGRRGPDEHFRVFPLSNWTELDVWRYIERERIELPSLYYAHEREVVARDGALLAVTPHTPPRAHETPQLAQVRFRTVGDATCTSAVRSSATRVTEVVEEIRTSRLSERGARLDDKVSETAMEDRKREGYF